MTETDKADLAASREPSCGYCAACTCDEDCSCNLEQSCDEDCDCALVI